MEDGLKFILEFLGGRSDYVIWGGFASHLHLGMEHGPDVDLYLKCMENFDSISKYFEGNGWAGRGMRLPEGGYRKVFEKKGFELDVIYSKEASDLLFDCADEIRYDGYALRAISKEWLLITKIGQISSAGRSAEKMGKDARTISQLREAVDYGKVYELSRKLPPYFWKTGFI